MKTGYLDILTNSLRYGLRSLRKAPAFTGFTICTLGIGLGVHIAIFSLVQAVLLNQLPYQRPSELVWAWSVRPDNRGPFNIPDFIDYRDRNTSFASIGAFAEVNSILTGQGDPTRLHGLRTSANLFQLLGARSMLGRTLDANDDRPTARPVVVLTHPAWTSYFHNDPGVVGRTILLDGSPYVVVGVLPREFVFPKAAADYAVPLAADSDPARARRSSINLLRVVGRLKPGVGRSQAEQELTSIAKGLQREYPVENSLKQAVALVPLEQEVLGAARDSLLIVIAAVGLLMLIVTANVSNSLLARSAFRRKEAAIRAALGASRWHMLAQSLTENLLLTSAGAVVGLIVARYGLELVVPYLPVSFPRSDLAAVGSLSILYAVGLAVILGSLLSLVSIHTSGADAAEALKSATRGSSGGPGLRSIRRALIVVEVALSFALLVGAGLLTGSVNRLLSVDPGFQSGQLIAAGVSLPLAAYKDVPSIRAFLDRAQAGLGTETGIESYSLISIPPVSGVTGLAPFSRKDRPTLPNQRQFANYRFAGAGYFRTMGIPIAGGREFTQRDDENSLPVAIVSQQFVHRYFPDTPPIGAHLMVSDNDRGPREVEIVGIAGNVKQFGLDDAPSADLYVSALQMPNERNGLLTRGFTMVFRSAADPTRMAGAIRTHLKAAEPEVALNVRTMDEAMAGTLSVRQFQKSLMALFAVFATLLAGLGLYSVMSFLTAQRTREIGVRLALGATRSGMTRLVVRQGLAYTAAGILLGLGVVGAGYSLIANTLYLTNPFDWPVISASVGLLFLVAIVATWLPARRAGSVDPMIVLRSD